MAIYALLHARRGTLVRFVLSFVILLVAQVTASAQRFPDRTDTGKAVLPVSGASGGVRIVNFITDADVADVGVAGGGAERYGRAGAGAVVGGLIGGVDINAMIYEKIGDPAPTATIDTVVDVDADSVTTAFLVGRVSDASVDVVLLDASASPLPDVRRAAVRVLHASATTGPIDAYLLTTMSSIPEFRNLAFKQSGDYQGIPADGFVLHVAPVGSQMPLLNIPGSVRAGHSYTIVIVDSAEDGSLDAYMLDDTDAGAQAPVKRVSATVSAAPESVGAAASGLALLPNPSGALVDAVFALSERCNVSVAIYSMSGEQVRAIDIGMMESGQHRLRIDTQPIPSGTYMVVVNDGRSNRSAKLVAR